MANQTEHLLSIKEASRLTGVPAYTLRFWEKEFQEFLEPPRTEGGQRRYDKASLEMVEHIKHLVDEEKYSIAGARGVLAMEHQESEQRSDIAVQLRNEEQIDLILDEIAAIVREKVVARLLREEGANQIVGQKAEQAGSLSASAIRSAVRDVVSESSQAQVVGQAAPQTSESQPRFDSSAQSFSHSPLSTANTPRVESPLNALSFGGSSE